MVVIFKGDSVSNNEIMKKFRTLNKKEQQQIRIKYKKAHMKEYKYSIFLYIIYVIIGIIGIVGLFLAFNYKFYLGMSIYIVSFVFLIFLILLLRRSNIPFYKYLKRVLKNIN